VQIHHQIPGPDRRAVGQLDLPVGSAERDPQNAIRLGGELTDAEIKPQKRIEAAKDPAQCPSFF
jgi:hypothetical protein